MAAALGLAVLGAVRFEGAHLAGEMDSDLESDLSFMVWQFGVFGLVACFLQKAPGRIPMGLLGFGWSALAFARRFIFSRPRVDELRSIDYGPAWYFALSIIMLTTLLIYDRYRDRIPQLAQTLVRGASLLMIALWLSAIAFPIAIYFAFIIRMV